MPVVDLGQPRQPRREDGPRTSPRSAPAHYVNDFEASLDAAGNVAFKFWHHSSGGDADAITLAMPYEMFATMIDLAPPVTESYVASLMKRLEAMGGRAGRVPEGASVSNIDAAKAAREAADGGE